MVRPVRPRRRAGWRCMAMCARTSTSEGRIHRWLNSVAHWLSSSTPGCTSTPAILWRQLQAATAL